MAAKDYFILLFSAQGDDEHLRLESANPREKRDSTGRRFRRPRSYLTRSAADPRPCMILSAFYPRIDDNPGCICGRLLHAQAPIFIAKSIRVGSPLLHVRDT